MHAWHRSKCKAIYSYNPPIHGRLQRVFGVRTKFYFCSFFLPKEGRKEIKNSNGKQKYTRFGFSIVQGNRSSVQGNRSSVQGNRISVQGNRICARGNEHRQKKNSRQSTQGRGVSKLHTTGAHVHMPCQAMPCHMPYYAMPYYAMPYYAMPYYAMPCHVPYYAMPYHTMVVATVNTTACGIPYHTYHTPHATIPCYPTIGYLDLYKSRLCFKNGTYFITGTLQSITYSPNS